jgi:hypothetical protein
MAIFALSYFRAIPSELARQKKLDERPLRQAWGSRPIQGQACFWCPPTMSDSGEVMEIVSIFLDKQVEMEGTDFS